MLISCGFAERAGKNSGKTAKKLRLGSPINKFTIRSTTVSTSSSNTPKTIRERSMTLQISNIKWTYVGAKPLSGPAQEQKGGVHIATFSCTCGEVWSATASNRSLASGHFVESHSGITVRCPNTECRLEWKMDRSEYHTA